MIKYVRVRFQGGSKGYQYLTTMQDLEQGDRVVVEARDWYQVAIFERYVTKNDIANRYIVGKLDMDEIEERKREAEDLQNLEEQIKERVKIVKERQKQEELASQDKQLAELLKLRESISKE